jgi:hypothetical protein
MHMEDLAKRLARRFRSLLFGMTLGVPLLLAVCSAAANGPPPSPPEAPKTHSLALLGTANAGRVTMDYLGYDEATNAVWIPGGNTGQVFVIDAKTEQVRSVAGFPVREADGRVLGPSSVSFGPRSAFIGNRADSSVCAVSTASFKREGCITLASTPDGLAYVASTSEVWATTPRVKSIALIGVNESGLKERGRIDLDGQPEGYAVDSKHGLFFTNLEDKDETVAIDVATHETRARWKTGCGKEGPRGLAIDVERGLLFVACTSGVVAFSLEHENMKVDAASTGEGVDNPAIVVGLKRVFAAAGAAGTLSVFAYSPAGKLTPVGTFATARGVRVVVADRTGKAFAADSANGRIWVVEP